MDARRFGIALLVVAGLAGGVSAADPVKERHELMEDVGKHAKQIGNALKAGKAKDAAAPAEAIAAAMDRFVTLFPPGSESPDSRAKPAIWTEREKFDGRARVMKERATAFAKAAASGGDAGAASGPMWKECKTCHDAYRVPKEGE